MLLVIDPFVFRLGDLFFGRFVNKFNWFNGYETIYDMNDREKVVSDYTRKSFRDW